MQKFAAILCILVILNGCDNRKEERNSLRLVLNEKLHSITPIESKIRDIDAIQVNLHVEIGALKDAVAKNEVDIKENKDLLANYVLSHKAAVTAVAASGAGIAGILADNLNDQERGVTIAAGLIGAAYCMFGDDDCSDATAKITYYGGQIALYKNAIATKIEKISNIQQRLADLEKSKAPFLAERTILSADIDATKSQIDALVCREPLCF